jgi:hypothetical protein
MYVLIYLLKENLYEVKGQWLNFPEHIIINMGRKRMGQLVLHLLFFWGQQTRSRILIKHNNVFGGSYILYLQRL